MLSKLKIVKGGTQGFGSWVCNEVNFLFVGMWWKGSGVDEFSVAGNRNSIRPMKYSISRHKNNIFENALDP